MIIDCHVHYVAGTSPEEEILNRLDSAGIDKMILFSHHPATFNPPKTIETNSEIWKTAPKPEASLKTLMSWAALSDRIIPFYWIDPLEGDAYSQVDMAVDAGAAGFKVICNRFYPFDPKPMQVWERIAKTGKPILFHSGILWCPLPASMYNRPAGFEPLFFIPNLRFAMAHVSWPWCDEMLAVYGFWCNLKKQGFISSELFIDTTPGTPPIYRKEVFKKMYTIGYNIEDNVIFGTDCFSNYNSGYAKEILAMDKDALDNAGVTSEQREKYYSKNVMRFLGL